MGFFDVIEKDPNVVVEFFKKFGINLPLWIVEWVMNIIAVALLIYLLWSTGKKIYLKWENIRSFFNRNHKWRRDYIKNGLEHSFGDYLSPEKQKCYVPIQSQSIPPHYFDEPDEAVASAPRQGLTDMFINDVFTPNNTNRFLYCILAGSGMGKTTFAVQLFVEYVKKYKKKKLPYEIFIKDMGEYKVLEEVRSLANKLGETAHHSILILDALDENLMASENFEGFREKLEEVISPFKFVVITCRSQFFPNEQETPDYSNIRQNTPNKNLLRYNKVYICPFSPNDIDLYIKKKYTGFSKTKRMLRKQAIGIIGKCRHLVVRPVLLSYIDDLIEGSQQYSTETEIYETLIEKWLEREVNDIPDQKEKKNLYEELVRFSQQLAIRIYQNWRETGEFKLDANQMDDFCQKNGFNKSKYQFRRRSLINHDATGLYKFSHKSFLEFFLSKYFFENSDFDFSFEGMDMAELFYQGFCKREYREQAKHNAFKIYSTGCNYLSNEMTLQIEKKIHYDFKHLHYVVAPDCFSELKLNWNAYDNNIQEFVEKSSITTISILEYQKGIAGIKQLLKAPKLQFLLIKGDMPPNSFIKEAQKKNVHVFLNDRTIVEGINPFSIPPLEIQLMLQMERQTSIFEHRRLQYRRDIIEKLLSKDDNRKESPNVF